MSEYICSECGFSTTRKESLTRHINTTHLNKNKVVKPTCPVCDKVVGKNFFLRHLINEHDMTEEDASVVNLMTNKFTQFKYTDKLEYYAHVLYKFNKGKDIMNRKFNGYCDLVCKIHPIEEVDIDYFFSEYLPYKKKHPKVNNSKEMCLVVMRNDQQLGDELYSIIMKERNAFYDHTGKYSAVSKKNKKYTDMTEEEVEISITTAKANISTGRVKGKPSSNNIQYWINIGYSEVDAKVKLHERQSTNSIESIMKREECNIEVARSKRQEITKKWLKTLDELPEEEKMRIAKLKVTACGKVSKAELEILKSLNLESKNSQYRIPGNKNWIYDIRVKNKIIEYNGDYWHCNPDIYAPEFFNKSTKMTSREKWELDKHKSEYAISNGYEILTIWENDYMNDRDGVIKQCMEFING